MIGQTGASKNRVSVSGNQQTSRDIRYPPAKVVLESRKTLRFKRKLRGSTLTTTKCSVIRRDGYQGELQLVYSYEVEFSAESSLSLDGIADALAYAVTKRLSSCDILNRPEYKVKTNIRHVISKDGKWGRM
jgi:hypothetical protein